MVTAPSQKCPGRSGGPAGVPAALPAASASVHRAAPDATAKHHAQDHLEDLRRRGWGGQVGQRPETRGGTLSRCPARPTHHDHSHHDGGDADEVQLPREELVDLPVAVLLRGWPDSVQRCPSSAPARPWPRVIAEGAQRGTALPPSTPQQRCEQGLVCARFYLTSVLNKHGNGECAVCALLHSRDWEAPPRRG